MRDVGYNSSVMLWRIRQSPALTSSATSASSPAAEKTFEPGTIFSELRTLYPQVRRCVHRFDHWLEMIAPPSEEGREGGDSSSSGRRAILQDLVPADSFFVEYRAMKSGRETEAEAKEQTVSPPASAQGQAPGKAAAPAPSGTSLILFPLKPKPHEVADTDGIVLRFWKSDAADVDSAQHLEPQPFRRVEGDT